jgi:hypothetical protein
LHLEEAESYLQSAPNATAGTGLTFKELNTLIARLELRRSMLGDFVSGHHAADLGEETSLAQERNRVRNWELLRQCADKTGLLFEPIDLAGTRSQCAVLWYPVEGSAPQEGTRLGQTWKLLNLKNPYTKRDRFLSAPHYERIINGQSVEVVPLGIYSLSYPKMPLLMIDFRGGLHLRRHELT